MNLTTIKTILTNNKPLIIIVGILFLIVSVWYITNQIASYDKDLAIAELKEKALNEKEEVLKQAQKDFFTSVKNTQKKNEQIASKQAQIEKDKTKEQEENKKQVQDILQPDKELEKVVKDAKTFLEFEPEIIGNKLAFSKEQVQLITALKVDYQRLEKELARTKEQLTLEQQVSTNLREELARATTTIENTNKVMTEVKEVLESYKAAAKKSKWRVFKDYATQAAVIGVTTYIATKAGH